tara:strand:- start:131 stop:499 length:369 start_codon:yes stop_codon:yes gene_type:complete
MGLRLFHWIDGLSQTRRAGYGVAAYAGCKTAVSYSQANRALGYLERYLAKQSGHRKVARFVLRDLPRRLRKHCATYYLKRSSNLEAWAHARAYHRACLNESLRKELRLASVELVQRGSCRCH